MGSEINKERVFGNFKKKGYARRQHTNSKTYRDRPGMSPRHLDSIRALPCCVCLAQPRSEAHHLKQGTGERGMGLRSTDKHAVPLCNFHHQEVEASGAKNERNWFGLHGLDALELAADLWQATNDSDQQQRIIIAHHNQRS